MFVNATFVSRAAQPSVVVPRSAVLDTGTRKIVYVARPNGVFEAREVAVGAPSNDLFPVTNGLQAGDRVVLKVSSHQTLHKTESGGVKVCAKAETAARLAEMKAKFKDAEGILVSEFVPHAVFSLGQELMLGARADKARDPGYRFYKIPALVRKLHLDQYVPWEEFPLGYPLLPGLYLRYLLYGNQVLRYHVLG